MGVPPMMNISSQYIIFIVIAAAALCSSPAAATGFTAPFSPARSLPPGSSSAFVHLRKTATRRRQHLVGDGAPIAAAAPAPSSPSSAALAQRIGPLGMSRSDGDGGGGGPGIATTLGLVGILAIFLVGGLAPFLDSFKETSDSVSSDLANSAVTRQDPDGLKQRQYQSKYDRLSRSRIQEKLGGLPAFYLADGATGEMSGSIYTSYADAKKASEAAGSTVKATTLDQVMYPLVLKRGRMKMAQPPSELQKAEEAIERDGTAGSKTYKLVPSAAAIAGATGMNMELRDGDVPLFIADRLAFAGSSGPQVPLFLEKDDAVTSYARLREAGGNKLPEEPSIRSTTLLEEIDSMERGTRPGVSQLAFYAPEQDLVQVDELRK